MRVPGRLYRLDGQPLVLSALNAVSCLLLYQSGSRAEVQRYGTLIAPAIMQKVQLISVDRRTEGGHPVQGRTALSPIILVSPITDELLQKLALHAIGSIGYHGIVPSRR
jgi:hypothetical protein